MGIGINKKWEERERQKKEKYGGMNEIIPSNQKQNKVKIVRKRGGKREKVKRRNKTEKTEG